MARKRIYLILFFCSLFINCYSRERADTLLHWLESYKLQVSDFKAKVPKNTNWAANTSYIIYVEGETTSTLPHYIIEARFNRYLSWMRVDSDCVLKHEQLHFDIAELYARKMRYRLHDLQSKKKKSIKIYNNAFIALNKECFAMQQAYDKATKHGTIFSKQKQWQTIVANKLLKTKEVKTNRPKSS